MMRLNMSFACWLFVAAFFAPFSADAQSSNPQETLKQYVSDLQRNPGDNALREKIIRHVQTMEQKPAIPEEARRHYVKASTFYDDAKQPSDSADAAEEFRQALLIAPWWGEAYMKMGLALETAQRYDDAIASLKLFMSTNPQDEVLRKAQDEIYKIEAKREKAAKAKDSSPEVIAAKQQNEDDVWLKKLDGARFIYYIGNVDPYASLRFIRGGRVYGGWFDSQPYDEKTAPIRFVEWGDGSESLPIKGKRFTIPAMATIAWTRPQECTISDDGQFMTEGKIVYKRIN